MVDITHLNTLQVPTRANSLIYLTSPDQIHSLITKGVFQNDFLFLGQGANILFTKDFPGTIIKNDYTGIKVIKETNQDVYLEAASGQNWHELVEFAVNHNWSGIENMALIPGTVGAAAVGNIAAYGQNHADVVFEVDYLDLATQKIITLSQQDCRFFYRDSIFKQQLKNKVLITKVSYHLSKTAHSDTSYYSRYESLEKVLSKFSSPPYSIQDVFRAIVEIRTQKMPDWKIIPSAGSFFKNPFVSKEKLAQLQKQIPDLQFYPTEKMLYPHPDDPVFSRTNLVKIPAGRLLDQLGWRGKKVGRVSTFDKHALVIINPESATGKEIHEFSEAMRADIKKNFDIDLEYEVVII